MANTTPRELGELVNQLDSFMADRKACLDRSRMEALSDAMADMEIGFTPYGLTAETEGWRGVDQEACKRDREGFEAIMANHAPGLPPDVVSDLYFQHVAWFPVQSRIVARRNEAARLIRWILAAPMSVPLFILIALADRGRALADIDAVKEEFGLSPSPREDYTPSRKRFALNLVDALKAHKKSTGAPRNVHEASRAICNALWPDIDLFQSAGDGATAWRANISNWRKEMR